MNTRLFAALAMLLIHPGATWSQLPETPAPEKPPIIRSVEVQYKGNGPHMERMEAALKAQVGKPFSDAVIEIVVRELFQSGGVINCRVCGETAPGVIKIFIPGPEPEVKRSKSVGKTEVAVGKKGAQK